MDFSQKINRDELREVFQRPFNPEVWKTILIQVFGANKIYEEPKPRELDNGDNAKVHGYDLGEIITPDKYTIGLFQFEITSGHNIPMNRVGLRGLVEKEIKYFYDAALVVYYNDSQWRLSYICDMKDGKTAPKRFTYVFGDPEQTYRTPISRFEFIKTKGATRENIHEAFSVEALNKDFYRFIADQFYRLVGATTGKGKNKVDHVRIMKLPDNPDNLTYQEFAVRLIGRTVFCWFLKEKKSKDGIPLLPAKLLSSKSLDTYKDYYHSVLERIFFQTLNTPMTERVDSLPDGCELIPFLNGGLFDYHPNDFYQPEPDGLSNYRNDLNIPDEWFFKLFSELEQYNFTIDENSPDDIEVSVDPEMLGRIFENLLAEIDPDSGETARKATGSFYTPREIVDYMAIESLVYYLYRKTDIDKDRIYPLFKPVDNLPEFRDPEKVALLKALDELKILDPACGSGAFPMGVLMKITGALQILDKDAAWWKQRQIEKIDNAKVRQDMQEKLDTATVEYARKIGIIQNTLYGVDIQPIAAEISKLRCFLTLIVDENVNDSKSNRGVEPLPNLEFKFVTADSLVKLPETTDFGGLFGRDTTYELAEKLKQLRIDYMQSYGKRKRDIKIEFLATQKQIFELNTSGSGIDTTSREYLISTWNPFANEKSDWFNPEWMFGVKDGFDVVIGNPPYVSIRTKNFNKEQKDYFNKNYKLAVGQYDLFGLFIERSCGVLAHSGLLCFIIPKRILSNENFQDLRNFILHKFPIAEYLNAGMPFESASVEANAMLCDKSGSDEVLISEMNDKKILPSQVLKYSELDFFPFKIFPFNTDKSKLSVLIKILKNSQQTLGNIVDINRGMECGFNHTAISKTKTPYKIVKGEHMDKYLIKETSHYVDVDSVEKKVYKNLSYYTETPKLLCKFISNSIDMAYDEEGLFNTNVIYNIHPKDDNISLKSILGVCNSKLITFWFYNIFANDDKLFPHIQKNQLESIPLPDFDAIKWNNIGEIASKIVKKKLDNIDTSALEAEIDKMVYELYGLMDEEIAIIENS